MTEHDANDAIPGDRATRISAEILWPFVLLASLFAWWDVANNMIDTLLPAFQRIMGRTDTKTAPRQVVFYGTWS